MTNNDTDIGPSHIVTSSGKVSAGHRKVVQQSVTDSRGLGDTIAKMTRAVGITPCGGCKQRQKKLNEIFPYPKGKK